MEYSADRIYMVKSDIYSVLVWSHLGSDIKKGIGYMVNPWTMHLICTVHLTTHSYGFSPVWVLMWSSMECSHLIMTLQCGHFRVGGLCKRLCFFNSMALPKLFLHFLQWNLKDVTLCENYWKMKSLVKNLLFWEVNKVDMPLLRWGIRKNLLTDLAFNFQWLVFMNCGDVTLDVTLVQNFATVVALSICRCR